MKAGPKAAVDGASLPFRPRGRPVLGILQLTLVISQGAVLDETLRDVGKDVASERHCGALRPGR